MRSRQPLHDESWALVSPPPPAPAVAWAAVLAAAPTVDAVALTTESNAMVIADHPFAARPEASWPTRWPRHLATATRQVLGGLKTFVLPARGEGEGGATASAAYCYSVWLRHLTLACAHGMARPPLALAELGPGASLGVGLAAMLAGAERYHALDVVHHSDPARTRRVFDELLALYRSRAAIPSDGWLGRLRPVLEHYDFPDHLLDPQHLTRCLEPGRIAAIRAALARRGEAVGPFLLRYVDDWSRAAVTVDGELDLVLSQGVMQYPERPGEAYRCFHRWLRPGGWMTHQVDFSAHETSPIWNGHWTYPDVAWRLVRGRKPFFLSREPYSIHLAEIRAAGFEVRAVHRALDEQGAPRHRLAGRFRALPDDDLRVRSALFVARKPAAV